MGSKREARQRRKSLDFERFEASKAATIAKVMQQQTPYVAVDASFKDSPRVAPHMEQRASLIPMSPKTPFDGSRFKHRVSWSEDKADRNGTWTWGDLRDWSAEEWENEIRPKFDSFAQLSWGEIDLLSSESSHKMHHGHEVGSLINEAQERWVSLGLEEFDSVFRFRLGGKKRMWGYIVQAHFEMVWWDREHGIYPTENN